MHVITLIPNGLFRVLDGSQVITVYFRRRFLSFRLL